MNLNNIYDYCYILYKLLFILIMENLYEIIAIVITWECLKYVIYGLWTNLNK